MIRKLLKIFPAKGKFIKEHTLLSRFCLNNQKQLWILYNQLDDSVPMDRVNPRKRKHFLIYWSKDSGPLMYWDYRLYYKAFIIVLPGRTEKEFKDQLLHYYLQY